MGALLGQYDDAPWGTGLLRITQFDRFNARVSRPLSDNSRIPAIVNLLRNMLEDQRKISVCDDVVWSTDNFICDVVVCCKSGPAINGSANIINKPPSKSISGGNFVCRNPFHTIVISPKRIL